MRLFHVHPERALVKVGDQHAIALLGDPKRVLLDRLRHPPPFLHDDHPRVRGVTAHVAGEGIPERDFLHRGDGISGDRALCGSVTKRVESFFFVAPDLVVSPMPTVDSATDAPRRHSGPSTSNDGRRGCRAGRTLATSRAAFAGQPAARRAPVATGPETPVARHALAALVASVDASRAVRRGRPRVVHHPAPGRDPPVVRQEA